MAIPEDSDEGEEEAMERDPSTQDPNSELSPSTETRPLEVLQAPSSFAQSEEMPRRLLVHQMCVCGGESSMAQSLEATVAPQQAGAEPILMKEHPGSGQELLM